MAFVTVPDEIIAKKLAKYAKKDLLVFTASV